MQSPPRGRLGSGSTFIATLTRAAKSEGGPQGSQALLPPLRDPGPGRHPVVACRLTIAPAQAQHPLLSSANKGREGIGASARLARKWVAEHSQHRLSLYGRRTQPLCSRYCRSCSSFFPPPHPTSSSTRAPTFFQSTSLPPDLSTFISKEVWKTGVCSCALLHFLLTLAPVLLIRFPRVLRR